MKSILFSILTLFTCNVFSQEAYNDCVNALELCPNVTSSVTNAGANITFCPGCEDDFNNCFTPAKTIWLKFTTNAQGGVANVVLSNPQFTTGPNQAVSYNANLFQANIPCNSASYTEIQCVTNFGSGTTMTIPAALPNTTYYLVLGGGVAAGWTAAEFTIDVSINGAAVNRPVPTIAVSAPALFCANIATGPLASTLDCEDQTTYRWYQNGVLVANTGTIPSYQTPNFQQGDIFQVETDCYLSCPVTITATLAPINVLSLLADAGEDKVIREGETAYLSGAASPNTTIHWSPPFGVSDSSSLSPIALPQGTTVYTLTVTDPVTGCVATDYVTISFLQELLIPNTFSPNGDGDNDTWEIVGIEAFPDCFVNIYNRWGQQVFQATGYNMVKAWDGTSKAGILNESVYFYEIQLRDADKTVLKGSITLIR